LNVYGSTPVAAVPGGTAYSAVTGMDLIGRRIEVTLQDGTKVETEYGYGSDFTYVTVTDQAGKQRRQVADALGRVVRVDEPYTNGALGTVTSPAQPTSYEYDGNDNLVKVTQSDGTTTQERKFLYDSLSRLVAERQVEADPTLALDGTKGTSDPSKWTKVLKYNVDGLLLEGVDARGVKTEFDYDGLNRVTNVTYTGETGYQTPNVTYTYDQSRSGFYNDGALTRVETAATAYAPATASEFDYDGMGRVAKHRQYIDTNEYAMEYGYNLAGQLTSEKYPSGKIVATSYDDNGRLAGIADQNRTYVSGLEYNGIGGAISQIALGNGTTETYTLNERMQMTGQELKKGTNVLQKYVYGYGEVNSSGSLVDSKNNGQLGQVESYIGTNKQWTQKFTYDSIGRLTETKEFRGSTSFLSYKQTFDFDRFGNMYRKAANNQTAGQETPIAYMPIEDSDISKSTNRFTSDTTYDEAGNVINDAKFRSMVFAYDANGRMVKSTKTSMPDASSVYDASGMRVAEKVNDVWRYLVYDIGGKLIAEYGGSETSGVGGLSYVHQDWQGSTRVVTNAHGFVKSRNDYTAFGEDINSGTGLRTENQGFGSAENLRQKYGLTERDDATGLDHTWFRKHETQAGRWTSPDPYNGSMNIGDPQSFNKYSYVTNQPTNYIDPSGLMMMTIICRTEYSYWWENTPEGPVSYLSIVGTQCYSFGGGGGGGTGWQPPTGPGSSPPEGPGHTPIKSPEKPVGPSEDKKYRDCVDDAWSDYRRIYFADGVKTVVGTFIIVGGVAYTVFELRHAGSGGVLQHGLATHSIASVGLATILSGGSLLKDVFSRDEGAVLRKKIAHCKEIYPSANHSYEGTGIP